MRSGRCADEGGQKRVVDVHDAPVKFRAQFRRDDLHVAREHDEVGLRPAENFRDLRKARLARFGRHRDAAK